ncbi:MAG TPA: preprotein translocase subunit SecE [Bdellovibrionota bacterium]|nr:preprotein translocase subunit SecE [Bdellovibrionota bacterium]
MNENRRWVTLSLISFGLVIYGVGFLLFRQINATFRLSHLIPFGSTVIQVLPVLIAVGVFLYIFRTERYMTHLDLVVGELKKVSWPNRKDTVASTIVVVITILIIASILGLYDAICNWIIQKII